MEQELLQTLVQLLDQFTSQGMPLMAQLPSKRELQVTILSAGLLSNPMVAQLDPEDLVDSAIGFSQLIEDRLKTYETPQSQVALLERLFRTGPCE